MANFTKKVLVLPLPLSTEFVCAVAINAATQKPLRNKGILLRTIAELARTSEFNNFAEWDRFKKERKKEEQEGGRGERGDLRRS